MFVGSNPGYKELELTSLLETAQPNLIIAEPELLPALQTVTRALDIPETSVLAFAEAHEAPAGLRSWPELFQYGQDDWVQFDDVKLAKETPACLVTTSGTTGLPKLASLSHHAWVALNCLIDDPIPKPYMIKGYVKPRFRSE